MARGRKVNSNGERSKQLLLEKALELFSEKGYHETKISDIVKAAHVTQPTFYLYFESKDSLYNDLNSRFQRGFDEIMNKQSEEVEEGLEGFVRELKQKVHMLFVYIIENPKLTKIGLFESEQSLAVKSRLTQQFTHLIHRYDCAHIIQSYCVDQDIVVDSFVGSLERLILTNLLEHKKLPCELASDLVHLYFVREISQAE
ncbi:TetR/AcrR family transcriptional regulator [Lysinibacillus sp. Bpr_S20]|uniref:TetR/AcrR family transcriptional regulator n=1 Tax=Lysinibacillus sp. Bpr_S20 TaxID=2933964 RepID=UPI0020132757|nr:TetR/AcrR family transcriptional regulator [Lysinibacillus sp. Bpr_S20]MCL1699912.1 TetR/AcrR family transcriptional regulator [Lysinibacillus sp. Bpr_S20]